MTEARSKRLVLPLGFIVKWAKFISGEWTLINHIDVYGSSRGGEFTAINFNMHSRCCQAIKSF